MQCGGFSYDGEVFGVVPCQGSAGEIDIAEVASTLQSGGTGEWLQLQIDRDLVEVPGILGGLHQHSKSRLDIAWGGESTLITWPAPMLQAQVALGGSSQAMQVPLASVGVQAILVGCVWMVWCGSYR